MNDPLNILISGQDVPDFYRMLRDFRRNRGNTFAYLQIELEERYPKLKERYNYGTDVCREEDHRESVGDSGDA